MPEITRHTKITISPEQFLNACTPGEVYEVMLLLSSPRFQTMLDEFEERPKQSVDPEMFLHQVMGTRKPKR